MGKLPLARVVVRDLSWWQSAINAMESVVEGCVRRADKAIYTTPESGTEPAGVCGIVRPHSHNEITARLLSAILHDVFQFDRISWEIDALSRTRMIVLRWGDRRLAVFITDQEWELLTPGDLLNRIVEKINEAIVILAEGR